MIKIKSSQDLVKMRKACEITKDTLIYIKDFIKPGVSTMQLNKLAHDFIISKGALPSFKDYCGYPSSICASVNDVVVHGIPNEEVILKEGDIIGIDVGANIDGFHGDAARTFPVGKISNEAKRLIKVTQQSFYEGIKGIKAGCFVGDISNKIQTYVEKNGYSIVRELVGHGIGENLHEDPEIPNFGRAGSGSRLNENMTIAIEPMVNMGLRNVKFLNDGWTCVTKDGKPSAHYENTVLITNKGVEILTI